MFGSVPVNIRGDRDEGREQSAQLEEKTMRMNNPKSWGRKRCKRGNWFEMNSANHKHCPDCSYWIYHAGTLAKLKAAEPRLKRIADASGNPKIWRASECSQEFLRNLIP